MSEDWSAVAARAAAGDRAARAELVQISTEPARRVARRLVDDPHAVDDVVQEALIEVLATIDSLRSPAAYLAWLGLVVRKQADRYRRRLHPMMLLDLILEPVADGPDPQLAAEHSERADRVRRALALARDADRVLLGLRYYADWSDAQLAELLGITRGAVRKRLYDARARLHPLLADYKPVESKEKAMTDVSELIGRIIDPATAPAPPPATALSKPGTGEMLTTGIKALDVVAPWPRGGTVDFLGPVGTGHLVILREIIHNLLRPGPAALVAVASTDDVDDSWPKLPGLVAISPPVPTLVVAAPDTQADQALDYGSRCAANLAATGAQVILAVDQSVAAVTSFAGRAGLTPAGGSVTGVRVAPHRQSAEPVPARDTADAVTVTSLEEVAAGRYPAIDLLVSRSAVLMHADPEHQRAAAAARRVLSEAADVRSYLTQNFWVAQEYTGVPGEAVTPQEAILGLEEMISR